MPNILLNDERFVHPQLSESLKFASAHAKSLYGAHRFTNDGTLVEKLTSGQPDFGARTGGTVKIMVPDVPPASSFLNAGGVVDTEDITSTEREIKVEHMPVIVRQLSGYERTLSLANFNTLVMAPAIEGILRAIDTYAVSLYQTVPYTAPDLAITDLTTLGVIEPHVSNLDDVAAPETGRHFLMTPKQYNLAAFSTNFAHADSRGGAEARAAFNRGMLMDFADMTAVKVKAVGKGLPNKIDNLDHDRRHVKGTFDDGSVAVNGVVSEGDTTMSWSGGTLGGTLKRGDLFTVAGADGTYCVTGDATGADLVDGDNDGIITGIFFSPAAPAGGFVDTAAITVMDSHIKNIIAAPGSAVTATMPYPLQPGDAGGILVDPRGLNITVMYHPSESNTDGAKISFRCFLAGGLLRSEFASIFASPYI